MKNKSKISFKYKIGNIAKLLGWDKKISEIYSTGKFLTPHIILFEIYDYKNVNKWNKFVNEIYYKWEAIKKLRVNYQVELKKKIFLHAIK